MKPSNAIKIIGLLAIIGFADAFFLTAKHYLGGPIPCSLLEGCDVVANSSYAVVFGVPVALFGAIFYLIFAIASVYALTSGQNRFFQALFWLAAGGFLFSIYLTYLQFFVINALCLYCLGSAATSTLIFILSFWAKKLS